MKNNFKNLTAILITFLRLEYTKKCVKSLRKEYKGINIIVGENGKYSEAMDKFLKKQDAKYIILPFDSGVCYGRNRLVDEVKTDFVLVGDDDFFYTKTARVEKMFDFIQRRDDFTLIAGKISERKKIRNYQGFMEFQDKGIKYSKFDNENGIFQKDEKTGLRYAQVDIAFNYFIARLKDIKDLKWDEKIKVAYEHSDWFIQLKKENRKVCFTPDAIVIHKPEGVKVDLEEYGKFRNRKSDREYFFEKHGLDYFIDMAGFTDRIKHIESEKNKYYAERPMMFEGRQYNSGDIIETIKPSANMRPI